MNTLEVFLGVCGWVGGGLAVMSPHDESTHLESGVEDRGMRSLSQILSDESLSYSLKHISTGEHSLHISLRSTDAISYIYISCFYDDVIKWKHVPRHWLLCRNSPVTAGKSPVNSPHTDRRRGALMFSLICAWTNGWVNNQDAGDFSRHGAHYDVTVMWCWIVIQWSGQPWDLSAFNASLLSNFELVKRVKLGGPVHYGRNGLKFGTLLYPDTIPWN